MNSLQFLSLPKFLAEHGGMLLFGATAFLGVGTLAMRLQRSPVHRQRLGEITIACTLLWVVIACLPLPRPAWPWPTSEPTRPASPARRDAVRPLILPESPAHRSANVPAVVGPSNPSGPSALAARIDQELLSEYSDKLFPRSDPGATAWLQTWRRLASAGTRSTAETIEPSALTGWLAALYLAGAAAVAAWLALGNVLLWRMVRHALRPPQWLRQELDELTRVGPRPPRLLVSDRCCRPVSCGVLRPMILLPAGCVRQGRLAQLRQILLHELGHVQQRDAVGNALLNLAMPLLYFHPLYWLLRSDVHLARELVADDWAAARSGKASYVAELIALARSRLLPAFESQPGAAALGLFRSPTNFYRRMHMLIKRTSPLATRCSPAWRAGSVGVSALAVAGAACLFGVRPAPALAQDREVVVEARLDKKDAPAAENDPKRREVLKQELEAAKAQVEQARQNYERLKAQQDEARALRDSRDVELQKTRDRLEQLDIESNRLQAESDDLARQKAVKDRAIDEFVREQLRNRTTDAKATADDNTFLRRLHLDIKGTPPDAATLKRFQDDPRPDKRDRVVDELLAQRSPDGWVDRLQARDATSKGPQDRAADPFAGGGLKVAAGPLDLIGLATSYADAVGDVRLAEVRLRAAQSPQEEAVQQVAVESARRKAKLLRTIAEVALAGSRGEYQDARKLVDKGLLPQSQLAEFESKLKILELILSSDVASEERNVDKATAK